MLAAPAAAEARAGQAGQDGLLELRAPAAPARAAAPALTEPQPGVLRFEMPLSEPLAHQLFQLDGPDRLVVDFPEVRWGFGRTAAPAPGVRSIRVGLFRPGRSRLVLDLDGPAEVIGHGARRTGSGAAFVVEFRVKAKAPALARAPAAVRTLVRTLSGQGREAPVRAPAPAMRPPRFVVVIDAGHGGRDSGAVHQSRRKLLMEKTITLDLARRVRDRLGREKRVKVVLTRDTDVKVPLPERVRIASAAGADLFVSIHADMLRAHPEISGASVYTLSEKASDGLSAALARGENGEEAVAGMPVARQPERIRRIVVDYVKRRMRDESRRAADLMIQTFRDADVAVLSRNPHRSANFHVLRSFETPSILVEVGFMSNLRDRRRMTNDAWRDAMARALAKSVLSWAAGREVAPTRVASID